MNTKRIVHNLHLKTPHILIMLINYPDKVSKFLKAFGFWHYSHASISTTQLSPDFFSFSGKHDFIVEKPEEHPTFKGQSIDCAVFAIPVSRKLCTQTTEKLNEFAASPKTYKYNYLGLAAMFFGIAMKIKNRFTCSGFVTEILNRVQLVTREESRRMIRPDDLEKQFVQYKVYEGTLKALVGA